MCTPHHKRKMSFNLKTWGLWLGKQLCTDGTMPLGLQLRIFSHQVKWNDKHHSWRDAILIVQGYIQSLVLQIYGKYMASICLMGLWLALKHCLLIGLTFRTAQRLYARLKSPTSYLGPPHPEQVSMHKALLRNMVSQSSLPQVQCS